jgi:hypothetical protein
MDPVAISLESDLVIAFVYGIGRHRPNSYDEAADSGIVRQALRRRHPIPERAHDGDEAGRGDFHLRVFSATGAPTPTGWRSAPLGGHAQLLVEYPATSEGGAVKKLIAGMVLAASALGLAAGHAEPSGKCGGGAFAVSSTGAAVCVTTGPVKGSAEARSTGGTNGYVVADGDSTNQSLPSNCLDGYAGVQNGGGYQGAVSDDNGDYTYGPQPPMDPPTVPPCT